LTSLDPRCLNNEKLAGSGTSNQHTALELSWEFLVFFADVEECAGLKAVNFFAAELRDGEHPLAGGWMPPGHAGCPPRGQTFILVAF
jgi:hypothetical protein